MSEKGSEDNSDKFQWDYSYFKWQDIPSEVRRQMVLDRSWAARTWINGKTTVQMDVPFAAARELYNKNWDGCRDLWKAVYRARKHPGQAPPIQYSQTRIMGWFSGAYMTVEDPSDQREPRETEQLPPAPPLPPRDPRALEYERKWREREQAKADRFNRAQQKRYEEWLKKKKKSAQ
jgi:hypothetical protein